ncbi:MAG: hypothetical protein ABFE01_10725 [Phycisphaerales bacterium]
MKKLGIAIIAAYLLFCLGLTALVDELFGVSTSPWFYVAAAGLLLPAVLPAWKDRFAQVAAVGYVAVLVVLPFVSLSPVKPFRQFHGAIRSGMTPEDVRGELARRFPANGRFLRPVEHASDEGLSFVLDPNDGRYNAELVVVHLAVGRVVSKECLSD